MQCAGNANINVGFEVNAGFEQNVFPWHTWARSRGLRTKCGLWGGLSNGTALLMIHRHANFQALLLCVDWKMPWNLKFDQLHWVKMVQISSAGRQEGKSTKHDQNQISSGGAQNTPACWISGWLLPCFLHKMPGNPIFEQFHCLKVVP